ncbi:guanylate kinase-like [Gigantopelta aegis]|uniref:guanylate kinase-like n=1 Tax=Gigantopelta aegis TaxID=1735272 RepID=UPI001B88C46C|nr:guanylate kinase-like [Gigantopelta aegis]
MLILPFSLCVRVAVKFRRVSRLCSVHHSSMTSSRIVVMSGPSGGGKSTLITKLFEEFPDAFAFSVSHTTRNPRPGESDGKEYNFVTRPTFEKMIDDKGFLEYAEFSGNLYGTSKKSVENIAQSGKICILDVEINGVKSIKQAGLKARYIFVKPPSLELLPTVTEALATSLPGSYDHVIVNNELEIAYSKLKGILIADIHQLQKDKMKAKE